jgi:dipeptidyl aminopeptidase/acylaminoacyl peptidase
MGEGIALPHRISLILRLMLAALVGLFAARSGHAVPLDVYGHLPSLEDVSLSPDGSRVALVRTTGNMRVVEVISLADGTPLSALRVGEQKLRGIEWADDRRLMIRTSATGVTGGVIPTTGMLSEWSMLQVYDVIDHKSVIIPDHDRFRDAPGMMMNVIIGGAMVRHVGRHTVLFMRGVFFRRQSGDHSISAPIRIRADLDSGQQTLYTPGSAATEQWLVDAAGDLLAEMEYHGMDGLWALKILRDGRMQEVASGHEAIDVPRLLGFGPTGDALVIQAIDNGESVWKPVSLKDGTFGPPMAERKILSGPIEDRLTNRMIGGVRIDDDSRYVFFDPAIQARWDAIVRIFDGEHVRYVSASDGFKKVVVRVEGSTYGFRYEIVDLDAPMVQPIGAVYQGVTEPLEVRRITYVAADNLQIPAYITLPRGGAAKNLPLIVLPHGGPQERDTADFDWWSQALAEQGYAVLRPNFRGSSLSRRFTEAGFGEWGRKMQTDLSDGVRYLVKKGIADPARVCIVGESYGGYAALAGVTLDPGVYRCAISVAGISDLKQMLHWINDRHHDRDNLQQRYWDRFMGATGADDPALEKISPVQHLDALNVPVLLIHGRDDTVVPFEQSETMFDALRGAKKDVELVTLKQEDHWLSRSETRLQMLQASVAFLRAHNPPD